METLSGLLVLAALTALFSSLIVLGRNELVKRRLTCPRDGTEAKVDVVQRYHADDPVRVRSCDHLRDPKNVDCDQGCLHPGT